MTRRRLDQVLAERGLVRSRTAAAQAVRAGRVRLGRDGPFARQPSQLVDSEAELEIAESEPYVSRGGRKLENALERTGVDPAGLDCLDVGASTGGFTDCLLKRQARRVVALDVGHGQLDWGIRNDPRVTVIERLNARELGPGTLPYAPSLVVCDVSFIPLARVVGAIASVMAPRATLLALVKPQFEVGPERIAKGGVVRDVRARRDACAAAGAAADAAGLSLRGFVPSGLPGPKGNRETFLWAELAPAPADGGSGPGAPDRRSAEAALEGVEV